MKKLITLTAIFALLFLGKTYAQDNPTNQGQVPRPAAGQGYWAFYSKTNGNGNCVLLMPSGNYDAVNLQANGGNDQIAGLTIVGGSGMSNATITMWDDPSGQTNDDWIEIRLLKPVPAGTRVLIGNIQTTFTNEWVQVTYHKDDGLQGKVSRIQQSFHI